eukprot:442323-Pyramimonas_sp.AAC.1
MAPGVPSAHAPIRFCADSATGDPDAPGGPGAGAGATAGADNGEKSRWRRPPITQFPGQPPSSHVPGRPRVDDHELSASNLAKNSRW